jgi:hypothetical protein
VRVGAGRAGGGSGGGGGGGGGGERSGGGGDVARETHRLPAGVFHTHPYLHILNPSTAAGRQYTQLRTISKARAFENTLSELVLLYPWLARAFKSPGYTLGRLKQELCVVFDKKGRAFVKTSKT